MPVVQGGVLGSAACGFVAGLPVMLWVHRAGAERFCGFLCAHGGVFGDSFAQTVGSLSTISGRARIVGMTVFKLIGVFGLFLPVALCQNPARISVEGIGTGKPDFGPSTAELDLLQQRC